MGNGKQAGAAGGAGHAPTSAIQPRAGSLCDKPAPIGRWRIRGDVRTSGGGGREGVSGSGLTWQRRADARNPPAAGGRRLPDAHPHSLKPHT